MPPVDVGRHVVLRRLLGPRRRRPPGLRVNGPRGGSQVLDFRIDPAGRSLLYVADQDALDTFELFLTPVRTRPGRVRQR